MAAWTFSHYPQAHGKGELAAADPLQASSNLPSPWVYKNFTVTARAKYHIKALVLSKHHYWGIGNEDALSSYDLALGWGPMSDPIVINQLDFSQGGRWFNYHWNNGPPIDPSEIIAHSSNNHIIAADQNVLEAVQSFKRYDVVELDGYLVDIQSNMQSWWWHTSLSRFDSGEGSCKVFWVTSAYSL